CHRLAAKQGVEGLELALEPIDQIARRELLLPDACKIRRDATGPDGTGTEIKMVLTTPFCPWAGELIQSVKTKAEEVVGPPVKVTLLAERWEPPPGLF
ncbi:MAG: hypothetical protein LC744_08125, partial [Chloroflexi bacterium]|nr:hypothetical protein [Chloroflexota bacterium]